MEVTSAGKGQRVLVLLWSAFSPLIYYLTCQAEWMSRKRARRVPLPSNFVAFFFFVQCLIIKKLSTNKNKNPAEMLSDQSHCHIYPLPPQKKIKMKTFTRRMSACNMQNFLYCCS